MPETNTAPLTEESAPYCYWREAARTLNAIEAQPSLFEAAEEAAR